MSLFKNRQKKSSHPTTLAKLQSAKSDCQLFARLYIACQNRGENQGCPSSISDSGTLRQGSKAKLLKCLDRLHEPMESNSEPCVSAVIFDGAAMVQILRPKTQKTFQECSENVFLPHIQKWLTKVDRTDIVWDVYKKQSLKASVREKRGTGWRRQVRPSVELPRNW